MREVFDKVLDSVALLVVSGCGGGCYLVTIGCCGVLRETSADIGLEKDSENEVQRLVLFKHTLLFFQFPFVCVRVEGTEQVLPTGKALSCALQLLSKRTIIAAIADVWCGLHVCSCKFCGV